MEIVNVAAIAVGTPARKRALAGLDLSEEEEFMTHFRHAAMAAVLFAGAGVASAQTTVITREPVESRTVITTEPLQLTPVQRQTVYRTIVRGTSDCGISRWHACAGKRAALFGAAGSGMTVSF